MKKFKTIGVLGGMGHCATAHFYQLLLSDAQKKFGSIQDDEYPQIIINSLALIGATEEGMEKNELILNQLIEGLVSLEKAGADFIVIPCNSVHNAIVQLRENTNLPIISIVEKVSDKVFLEKPKKILVLSSETTDKYGLYDGLQNFGITGVKPGFALRKKVTKLIHSVMGNNDVDEIKKPVVKEINSMYKSKKIDSVLLGCTELPVAINDSDTQAKLFDSLKILSEAAVEFSGGMKE